MCCVVLDLENTNQKTTSSGVIEKEHMVDQASLLAGATTRTGVG